MQTEKSRPEGERITRITKFPANLVSGIIRWPEGWDFSVCIGDRCFIIFLTYDIKDSYSLPDILFIFDILRRITNFSERHSLFFAVGQKWRHFWNEEFWRHV